MSQLPRYQSLLDQLLWKRAVGSFPEAEEDDLLEQMDAVWWNLTEAEIGVVKQSHADAKKITSAAELDLVDENMDGPFRLPRRAA
ncbi:MAG: hypothetical protein H7338_01030 [Candidatus Sericytochromatia bacterium]|nr:hypothetical protein [Candidatus Sericytochromatia bacterium]